MDAIFLPTVQHSGTWFLIELFKRNPKLHNVELGFVLFGDERLALDKRNVIHTHVDGNVEVMRKLVDERGKHHDILGHHYYKKWNDPLQEMLVREQPTVIPMRDPLLSIISRHRRHPTFAPHTYMVDAWLKVCDWVEYNPFFVPIDQDLPEKQRIVLLDNMVKHCAIEPWPLVTKWAIRWEPQNKSIGGENLLHAYYKRDRVAIQHMFPQEWAALRKHMPKLRALFEDHGYEELLWW